MVLYRRLTQRSSSTKSSSEDPDPPYGDELYDVIADQQDISRNSPSATAGRSLPPLPNSSSNDDGYTRLNDGYTRLHTSLPETVDELVSTRHGMDHLLY